MPPRRAPRKAARASARPVRPKATRRRTPGGPGLTEPPHGHIVCRGCGRIHPLELSSTDLEVLVGLTVRGPDGWAVERVAYSIAAVCPKCQRATAPAS